MKTAALIPALLVLASAAPPECLTRISDNGGNFRPDEGWTIPHLASGGGFETTFQVLNLAAKPAQVEIWFFNDRGRPLPLPVGTGNAIGFRGALPADGRCDVSTVAGGPNTRSGYARVKSTPPNTVAVTTLIRRQAAGGPEFHAALPHGVRWTNQTTAPFVNWDGPVTALAQVNDTAAAQTLRITARGDGGWILCQATISLAPGEHQAFLLSDRLPCTVEQRGLLEFETSNPQGVAAAILLFQGAGSFTALTPSAAGKTLRTAPAK
ncbi:MAG: hypothetical protein HY238_02525 [Acidobacteria bacterium]|nr:hypothetical protein [Acidobacteriota bacterium]